MDVNVFLNYSAAVSMPFEVEVKLQDPLIELALEAVSFLDLPFSVHNGEGDVFVRSTTMESDSVGVLSTVGFNKELGGNCLIEQIGIENVEFVALNNFGRWILTVVMCLVVLIPLIALLDRIEETWFAPLGFGWEGVVVSHLSVCCFAREKFLFLTQDDIREFLLVSSKTFILSVLEHLKRGIVKSKVVDDIEPDSSVKSCLSYFLSQTELLLWWFDCHPLGARRSHRNFIFILFLINIHRHIFGGF
jgi:hypothetical protein